MTASVDRNYWQVPQDQQRVDVQTCPQKPRQIQTSTSQRSGLLGKLSNALNVVTNTTYNVGKKAGTQLDYFIHQNITKESQQRFWSFGLSDTLLGEFPCKCVSGNKAVKGWLFLAYQHVCFLSYSNSSSEYVRVVIPLSYVNLVKACEVISTGEGILPSFRPVAVDVTSNLVAGKKGLQIFTNDQLVHQFFGFKLQFYTVFQTLQRSLQMNRLRATQSPPSNRTVNNTTTTGSNSLYPSTQTTQTSPAPPQVFQQTPQTINVPVSNYAQSPSPYVQTQPTFATQPVNTQPAGVEIQTQTSSRLYPVVDAPTVQPQKESVRPLTFAELKALQSN